MQHPWLANQTDKDSDIRLSLKDLLQISTEGQYSQGTQENLSEDFQSKQVERIVEAIALSLPPFDHSQPGLINSGT